MNKRSRDPTPTMPLPNRLDSLGSFDRLSTQTDRKSYQEPAVVLQSKKLIRPLLVRRRIVVEIRFKICQYSQGPRIGVFLYTPIQFCQTIDRILQALSRTVRAMLRAG